MGNKHTNSSNDIFNNSNSFPVVVNKNGNKISTVDNKLHRIDFVKCNIQQSFATSYQQFGTAGGDGQLHQQQPCNNGKNIYYRCSAEHAAVNDTSNDTTNNSNCNNNYNSSSSSSNDKSTRREPSPGGGSKPFNLSILSRSVFTPLQYVRRKLSLKKPEKEVRGKQNNSSTKKSILLSSSSSPAVGTSSSLSSSSLSAAAVSSVHLLPHKLSATGVPDNKQQVSFNVLGSNNTTNNNDTSTTNWNINNICHVNAAEKMCNNSDDNNNSIFTTTTTTTNTTNTNTTNTTTTTTTNNNNYDNEYAMLGQRERGSLKGDHGKYLVFVSSDDVVDDVGNISKYKLPQHPDLQEDATPSVNLISPEDVRVASKNSYSATDPVDDKMVWNDKERQEVVGLNWMENVSSRLNVGFGSKDKKKKIRTNPWIAKSTGSTPLSSPSIPSNVSHHPTYPNSPVHDKFMKANLHERLRIITTSNNNNWFARNKHFIAATKNTILKSKPKLEDDNVRTDDDDLNSCSEGYYSSSFGSLSGCSLESPDTSPSKTKKMVTDSNNDSGFFSVLSSYGGYFSAGDPFSLVWPRGSDSEEESEEGPKGKTKNFSTGDCDMLLPCSRDLIAINKLLRMSRAQRDLPESSVVNNELNEGCDGKVKPLEGFVATSENSESSVKMESSKISFEIENQIFELKIDFYDEVFDDSPTEPNEFDGHRAEKDSEIHETETNLAFPRNCKVFSSRASSESEDDNSSSSSVHNYNHTNRGQNLRTFRDILSSLETSHSSLCNQRKEMESTSERLRRDDEMRKRELKKMREISIDSKRKILLQTLQRLKECLDQQKAWLQRAYDGILEKRWLALHQFK